MTVIFWRAEVRAHIKQARARDHMAKVCEGTPSAAIYRDLGKAKRREVRIALADYRRAMRRSRQQVAA